MIPILVADDHGFIRAGVEAVLRGTPFQVVATAASGEEALAAIEQHNPAVVLLDINMPGLNGVAALEALREKGDERPVVLLTAEITDRQLMAVMRAGVQGIVSKDGAESELVQVLERVHAGEKAIAPAFLQRALDLSLKPVVNPFAKLNARERDITRLVAKGMRNREIGQQLNIGEGTVKVYLHAIYQKLNIENRTELALMVVNDEIG
ncbi:response regulator transcription factor [Novosphingobium sp. NBM11]|jgi:two-component system nitrate/nitrite response regulator NarL|uniref:response regulator n=1 Tax=Novosphingobium sp. NBM11 TaxID=2596914 RepID=UPI00189243AF|nr:response regulator transcription factor [Novosphingobium sp. NBM11]MBF5089977.1 response regulator transcription factor [Novosphingobium sp. NBM11]